MLLSAKRLSSLLCVTVVTIVSLGQCSNFESNYPSGVYTTANTSWRLIDNCVYGGDFQEFSVVEGAQYQWVSCYGSGFDTEITLWDESHTSVLGYSTDDCAGIHGNIAWTATFTGIVHLLLSEESCQTNSICHRMWWRMLSPPPPPPNDGPCNALNIPISSICQMDTLSNAGATASGILAPSCGAYNGGDMWYSFTVPTSGNVTVTTRAMTVNDMVMAAYVGSCSIPVEIDCNDDTNDYMPELELTGLTPGTNVFIRLFSYNNAQVGQFEFCAYEPCTAPPANDASCSAEELVIGDQVLGDNGCATSAGIGITPSCWTGGSLNTVWYSFEAPAGGEVRVDTEPTSLTATQIALFTGSCSFNTLVDCNQNTGEGCGTTGSSSIAYSGLTPGSTYYIAVDGQDDAEGQFLISVSNMAAVTPSTGSDCSDPIAMCSPLFSVADPGPQGTGNYCDFSGEGNCTGGERNALWYQIDVGADGDLRFILTPTDGGPTSCGTETDYDFVLWKMSGSGSTTSCDIMASDASQGLLACNYDQRGVTGLSASGNSPAGYNNCFDTSFEQAVSVTSGDVLLLAIQNYTGSTRGFTIDFGSSDPGVVTTSAPSVIYWSGGNGTEWDDQANWGNCGVLPSCTIDAVIPASASVYPVLSGEENVKSLTIENGASMSMSSGSLLHICGDFINNGELDFDRASTLLFENPTGQQELNGNLTGVNALGNLYIDKGSGSVQLYTSLEIKGDFLSNSTTSWINTRGNEVYLGGNFRNSNGATSFRGVGTTGSLIFNGTQEQSYSQGASNLNLQNVVIQNTGAGVSLLTDMRIKNNTGTLTLIEGVIRTNDNLVFFRNRDHLALNEGNPNSYIEGELRRYINPTGLYHLPVGSSSTGYQRADIRFRDNNIGFLTVVHSPWPVNPGPLMSAECQTLYDLDALDNGFYTISANANAGSADYDITLYNHAYGNTGAASGWTVMKDSGSGWFLDGDCYDSTADTVRRTGLTGFSRFATAQASNPLPIELMSFRGKVLEEGNLIEWVTATEVNNDHFNLEVSKDGVEFYTIHERPGAGNSTSELSYSYVDRDADSGDTYYRLKQTDFDGTFSYSDVIVLSRASHSRDIELWPTPVQDQLFVRVGREVQEIEGVYILDMLGRVVLQPSGWSEVGGDLVQVKGLELLEHGLYILSVTDKVGDLIIQERFAKD
jgi:hypothetical protein